MAFIKKIKVGGVSYDISLNDEAFGSGLWVEQYDANSKGKLVVSGAQLAGSGLLAEGCRLNIKTASVNDGAVMMSGARYQVGIDNEGRLTIVTGEA